MRGSILAAWRKDLGWSQERLAHESGLGRSFTGAIERGEKDIRMRTLCKLSSIFEITLSTLLKDTDDLRHLRRK